MLQAADAELREAERLVTITCAAKRLAVCPRTIRRWIAAGKLSAIRYPSGRLRVSLRVIAKIKCGQMGTIADMESFTP